MNKEIEEILVTAKELASRYKKLTGKPLGITGEIAEFNAAKLLNLELTDIAHPIPFTAVNFTDRGYNATIYPPASS